MRKHYPLNSAGDEDAGQMPWTDGVPATGVEGSYFGNKLFTDAEAEILAAIDGAGLARNGSDLTQLIQAIARGLWLGQFGGTASGLTATLPNSLVLPGLLPGMRVRGIAAFDFTGTGGTLKITGVGAAATVASYPLVASDGVTALASGAWKAGQFLTFEIDASGNARFGGTTSGASAGQILTLHGNAQIMRDQYFDLVTGWTTQDKNTFTTSTYANGIFTCGAGEGGLLEIEANFAVQSGYYGHGYDMLFCVNGAQTGGPTTYPTNIRANRESSSQYDGFEAFGDSAQVFLNPGDQFSLWLYYTTLSKAGYAGTPWGRFTSDAATNLKIRRVLAL